MRLWSVKGIQSALPGLSLEISQQVAVGDSVDTGSPVSVNWFSLVVPNTG